MVMWKWEAPEALTPDKEQREAESGKSSFPREEYWLPNTKRSAPKTYIHVKIIQAEWVIFRTCINIYTYIKIDN